MHIFAVDSNSPPKITDWIQAIGALIAIIAALFGFVKLFIKDKKREQEIHSLTDIAGTQQKQLDKMKAMLEESQKQTLEFSIQTAEMQETNKLYRNHLQLLSESNSDNKAHQGELLRFQNEQRKNEILPRFKFSSSSHSQLNISISFQLVSGTAYFESFSNFPDTTLNYISQIHKGQIIGTNETISFNGNISGPFAILTDYQHDPLPIAELLYRNEDGDLYKQTISRQATNFEISKPEEVPAATSA